MSWLMRETCSAIAIWESFLDRVLGGEFDEDTVHFGAKGALEVIRAAA